MAAAGFKHFLFRNTLVKIEKIMDTKYEFEFIKNEKSALLIRSLYMLGLGLNKIEDGDEEIERYELICDSIQTLNQLRSKKGDLLGYLPTLNCCLMIGDQVKLYLKNNVVCPYIDIDNILVIDDAVFIYMNEEFNELEGAVGDDEDDTNKYIEIDKPYDKHFLMGNELFNLVSLPGKIHHTDWIYSLGLLGVYLLTNNNKIQNIPHEKYAELIEMIQSTKLYFMLLRCLYKKTYERKFLYTF